MRQSSALHTGPVAYQRRFKQTCAACVHVFPQLAQYAFDGDGPPVAGSAKLPGTLDPAGAPDGGAASGGEYADGGGAAGTPSEFSGDIENECNAYWQKLYQNEMTVPEIVRMLQRFQKAGDAGDAVASREFKIYQCMVFGFVDEYKFYREWPEKQLLLTSELFGALIQHSLATDRVLGVALRCVLDALRHPPGTKMFRFGVDALSQFRTRLAEWPQYGALILQIPDLAKHEPELVQFVRSELERASPSAAHPPSDVLASLHGSGKPDRVPLPGRGGGSRGGHNIQDTILFIMNNVTFDNLDMHAADLVNTLDQDWFPWFCHYLVSKRVSQEPNFHGLYNALIDRLAYHQHPALTRLFSRNLLYETYACINKYLNSENILVAPTERSHLKNLGMWLGQITLAKDIPIKHRHLSLK
ncbi:hypothetical protein CAUPRSCDRAFT_5798, partial [Caulochytrium protostelioides]